MTSAKGLGGGYVPFGMAAVSDDVYKIMSTGQLTINYTYSGHPVGCAVVKKIIEIMVEEKLVENAAQVGKHLKTRLAELEELPHVGKASNVGLLGIIRFVDDKFSKEPLNPDLFRDLAIRTREAGFLYYFLNGVVLMFPPRTITTELIDLAMDNLKVLVQGIKSNEENE
jgi:adenosylmethionine-8-amino-7-oxononanoate aminotransferase